ncbi:hypothetical protein HBA54_08690 [Pelagibius litoralis]|uniref:Uncharacterized protein n=1 Tax=Pelagibius litoralis TaxID=374515 RepID=A0A967C8G2_9PROT|nr:hypothetical protein [Pelagibius litoralis]NIA68667.1 hypothetical protein [Pelagibius litoralis]
MPADRLFSEIQFIGAINEIAERNAIRIEVSSDFDAFRNLRRKQTERPPLSPIFDPAVSDLGSKNAFWIKGSNSKGEVIHTQSVRLNDLTGCSLAEHLHQRRAAYAPPGITVDIDQSSFGSAPASQIITGDVCYHGELWLKGGNNGLRGGGLTSTLPRLALALALLEWSPDYIFGLVHPLAACKGLAAREGYMHLAPGGILWQQQDSTEVFEEWLVWMSREDIQHVMRFSPLSLYEKLEKKGKARRVLDERVAVAA